MTDLGIADLQDLTPPEFGVWLGSREASEVFNIHWAWQLSSALDEDALSATVRDLVQGNAAFQRVLSMDDATPRWKRNDGLIAHFEVVTEVPCLKEWLAHEGAYSFDLYQECLLRVHYVTDVRGQRVLSILTHHLISDGQAMNVLAAQISAIYEAHCEGRPSPLEPPEPLPIRGSQAEASYWTEQLRDAEWPDVFPSVGRASLKGFQVRKPLAESTVIALERVSESFGATASVFGVAVLAILLRQYGVQRDVLIATPFANRSSKQNDLIACRAQMLPLRVRWQQETTCFEMVRSVRQLFGEAMLRAEEPISSAASLFTDTPEGQSVSFQVLGAQPALRLGGNTHHPREGNFNGLARFDLEFDLILVGAVPEVVLTYRTPEGTDKKPYQSLCDNFVTALEALVQATPTEVVGRIDVINAACYSPVLRGPRCQSFPASWMYRLDAQVAASPAAPALSCGEETITFAEFNQRIEFMSRKMRAAGLGPGSLIGLAWPRDIDQVVMIHAAWRNRSAVVPVDHLEPPARISEILKDACVDAIACSPALEDVLGAVAPLIGLDLTDVDHSSKREKELECTPAAPGGLTDNAYVLYTSGTTGRPKGVLVDHGNLAAFAHAQVGTSTAMRVGLTASIGFDVYFAQLVHILRGACIVLADDATYRNPQQLAAWVETQDVRYLDLTTSMARAAMEFGLEALIGTQLEWLELGGDPVDAQMWSWLREKGVVGENGYGSTETTITSTTAPFCASDKPTIGVPVAGTHVYILGPEGRLSPLGAAGELVVGGPLVSRGYPGSARTTADRFIPDPYSPAAGRRAYRTGDRARFRGDGSLEFLGRADDQLKIRGYRVDPYEVEGIIREFPGVMQVHVARRPQGLSSGVVVFIVANDSVTSVGIVRHVSASLPSPAVPQQIVRVPEIVMTASGKVDEKAISRAAAQYPAHAASRSVSDDHVTSIWADTLGHLPARDDTNFFEDGGTSLTAAALVGKLNKRLRIVVDLAEFFVSPTPDGLRRAVADAPAAEVQQPNLTMLELSDAQLRLCLQHELEPDSAMYMVPWGVVVPESLDEAAITRRWRKLLGRHASLRLRVAFSEDGPQAHSWGVDDMPMTFTEGNRQELEKFARLASLRRLSIERDPLIELRVFHMGEDGTAFVFVAHHIVVDQASMKIIEMELLNEMQDTLPPPVSAHPSLNGDADREFWRSEVEGTWDRPWDQLSVEPIISTRKARTVRHRIDADKWLVAAGTARERGVSLLALLAAAVWSAGERYGAVDTVVGTTMDCRPAGAESVVGLYVNPVALRMRPDPWLDAEGLISYAAERLRTAHRHRRMPFNEVVRLLGTPNRQDNTPLFQILLDVQPVSGTNYIFFAERIAKYDLSVVLVEDGELSITYNSDRFLSSDVEILLGYLMEAFNSLSDRSKLPVRLRQLPDEFRCPEETCTESGKPSLVSPTLLPDRLRQLAEEEPGSPAVTCGNETLTRGELWAEASRLACDLLAVGVRAGDFVAIYETRSLAMVVGALGIWMAGAGYLPLDPAHPVRRSQELISDVGPSAIVSSGALVDPSLTQGLEHVLIHLQEDTTASSQPDIQGDPALPAYVIYTSGTTGRPKGVIVDHGRLAYSTAARCEVYPDASTFLLMSSLSFDSSVAGLWGTLASGGQVVVADLDEIHDPERLLDSVEHHGVERFLCVPTLYENLLDAASHRGGMPCCLQEVVLAGERVPPSVLTRHFALSDARLVNEYGPTEASVWCTYRRWSAPSEVDIGFPIPGSAIRLLDQLGRRVPPGVVGEIHVAGPGVTIGYLHRARETASSFVPDPWGPPGSRLYRTGDLARRNAEGALEFVGRRDEVVKVHGVRIELNGLDDVMESCPGVSSALTFVAQDQLAALVVAEPGGDTSTIRKHLRDRLPEPEVPSRIELVPELPVNSNGKLDRAAASALLCGGSLSPVDKRRDQAGTRLNSVDDRERLGGAVGLAWADVLGHSEFDDSSNFFDVGGHSLAVPRLREAIQRSTGARPAVLDLFTEVTLEAQVRMVAALLEPIVTPDLHPKPNHPVQTIGPDADLRSSQNRRSQLAKARGRSSRSTDSRESE